MADEKPTGGGEGDIIGSFFDTMGDFYKNQIGSPFALLVFVVFTAFLIFLGLLLSNVSFKDIVTEFLVRHIGAYVPMIKIVLKFFCIISIAGIIYFFLCIREINSNEYHKYKPLNKEEKTENHNMQWQIILDHMESPSSTNWRMAILEADTMLDEMLKKIGAEGETLGERLRSMDVREFRSLQMAWDAHKMRNTIAHEGLDYQLNKHEAQRVISLYKQVFSEFQYI